ncbi:hypothetical protein NMY22_g9970 [Coprinellus aureogranulatus]|nr:hypothetical protein NMY22_g9970 [Coprinellus aureogranulatus]
MFQYGNRARSPAIPQAIPSLSQISSRTCPIPVRLIPFEVLAKIFAEVVQPAPDPSVHPFNPCGRAVDLLSITHTCSYFRSVALKSPYLWSLVVFLDHPDLLDTILTRSQTFPITLSFLEGEQTHVPPKSWNKLWSARGRIHSIRAHVAEGFSGAALRTILSLMSPNLEDLFVQFHGERHMPLKYIYPAAPIVHVSRLRRVRLINCFIPSPHAAILFPGLTHYRIERSAVELRSLPLSPIPLDIFFRQPATFRSLRVLALIEAIRPCMFDSVPRNAVDLPLLENLVVGGSAAVCKQMAMVLRLQPQCSRRVNISFKHYQQHAITEDAEEAGASAAAFIDPRWTPIACSLSFKAGDLCVRLSASSLSTWTADFTFSIPELEVRDTRGTVNFLQSLVSPAAGIFPLSPRDTFFFRLCDHLARSLRKALGSATHVLLDMDPGSSFPYIFNPYFWYMKTVRSVTVESFQLWANHCLPSSLYRHFAGLRQLTAVVDSEPEEWPMRNLADFVDMIKDELEIVKFIVPRHTLDRFGYAVEEGIRSRIGTITKDFPLHIALQCVITDVE